MLQDTNSTNKVILIFSNNTIYLDEIMHVLGFKTMLTCTINL